MFGFTQADDNLPSVLVSRNIVSSKYESKYAEKCSLACAPLILTIIGYPLGLIPWNAKCKKKPVNVVYDCITDCSLPKSIDIVLLGVHKLT